ncbi:MAG: hypothetical protein AAGU10_12435 [Methanosarcina mazei]|nr:hypothetical protein [Methanosarcina soligelidi]
MVKNKITIGVILLTMLVGMALIPPVSAVEVQQNITEKENQDNISVPDPWFEKGDELNRLSGDERRALAEQNETV